MAKGGGSWCATGKHGWGITCGAGTLEVRAPRVNDRRVGEQGGAVPVHEPDLAAVYAPLPEGRGGPAGFVFAGLSTGDFRPALETLLGEEAAGLSATNIARLTAVWEQYREFRKRRLAEAITVPRLQYYLTRIPGSAPLSGLNRNSSFPPGPAARTIPSETPKRILRGARLVTITVSRPASASGA